MTGFLAAAGLVAVAFAGTRLIDRMLHRSAKIQVDREFWEEIEGGD